MINDEWLFQKGKRVHGRVVKIRAGLEVIHRMHKAPGGLIRAQFVADDRKYKVVNIFGGFFCFPKYRLGIVRLI